MIRLAHSVERFHQVSRPVEQDRIAEPLAVCEFTNELKVPDGLGGVAAAQVEQRERGRGPRLDNGHACLLAQRNRTSRVCGTALAPAHSGLDSCECHQAIRQFGMPAGLFGQRDRVMSV